MWGSGNAGGGVNAAGGSVLDYQSQVPTVTGALGDFLLAGAATSRAWDEALSTYTPLLCNKWKKLAAAIAPGPLSGFGGNAYNVERNAHIVLR